MNIFGLNPVVVFGTEEQKRRMLPPLIAGEHKACFAVTEPDAGLDTLNLKTKAERRGDHYVVSGQKIWISTAQVADKMLLLARTTPAEQVKQAHRRPHAVLHRPRPRHVEVREIEKMGRKAVDSNQLFFDGLPVPVADRIGEEGRGFDYILHGMNPERILVAAEAVGLGRAALARAVGYAKERVVFGRPIGQNQAIQHPLARRWMELEAAQPDGVQGGRALRRRRAVRRRGERREIPRRRGRLAACETAVLTHGGMGYAKEFHVERYLREAMIAAPRAGQRRDDPELHRREGAGAAEVVLGLSEVVQHDGGHDGAQCHGPIQIRTRRQPLGTCIGRRRDRRGSGRRAGDRPPCGRSPGDQEGAIQGAGGR